MFLPSPAVLIPDVEERGKGGSAGGGRTDERASWNKEEDFFVSLDASSNSYQIYCYS